jgi:enamine deaminase RidA (YjgF/YER057c/UK114 family)
MERKLISSASIFEEAVSFSRAVVVGDMVFVSGCTGYDYATTIISDDIVEQTEQTFKNIETALIKAGASLKDVVRVHYILKDTDEFEKCWPVFKKYFGDVKPAATVFCAKLTGEKIKIEIEVTAVKQKV